MPKRIFVSYSTDDVTIATTLREGLEARGIDCWIAPRDIAPGKDYAEQIIEAIEESSILLLILSASSNRSVFVLNEVERAVAKRKLVVPLRIEPVQPSRSLEFFISSRQWVEAWEQPLAATIDILTQAIRNHLGAQPAHYPIAPAPVRVYTQVAPHNLPHQLTPFIGREAELAALDELLAEPNVRLVTILGPGGMGKTRLSLAVAEHHLNDPRFAEGVHFVPLASLSEVQHIITALVNVLGLSPQSSSEAHPPQQQVLDYLRLKQMLLIFDNFEHLLDGVDLVVQILQAAPRVCIIATSRERLHIPGEHLFPLQGLAYANPAHLTSVGAPAAAQLFLQSARQVQQELALNEEEMSQVNYICELVGGMPLGIELAAAWAAVLSPQEIATEIQSSLDFLGADRRSGSEQHRSMRAVFDATWNRLDPVEQSVFARLSIFRGGFTREAAEQVVGASLRLLSVLVGKSLIQHERARGRYTFHELLRQFGEEKLLSLPQVREEAHDRHCAYFTSFLQVQESRLKGAQYVVAMTEIEADLENLRLVWQWAVAHRRLDEIDSVLNSLCIFHDFKSWFREGEALLRQAVDELQMDEPVGKQGVVYGKVLARQGYMRGRLHGEMGESLSLARVGQSSREANAALLEKSLAILRRLNAHEATGDVLNCLGSIHCQSGNFERGLRLHQDALAVVANQHDLWALSRTYQTLGFSMYWSGKYREAIEYYRRGVAICEDRGDFRTLGDTLYLLGDIYKVVGEYEEGRKAAEAALKALTAVGDKRGIAWSLYVLSEIAWLMGNYTTAQKRAEEGLALFQELGMKRNQEAFLNILGNIACSLSDLQMARHYFGAVLKSHLAAGTLNVYWIVPEVLNGMATVLAREGKRAQALSVLKTVLHLSTARIVTKEQSSQLLAELTPEPADPIKLPSTSLEIITAELLKS